MLAIVYGQGFVQAAATMATDPRDFVSCAAMQAHLSEVELLKKLSTVTAYPFLSNIPLVDLRALPRHAKLDRFRAYGCIPLARAGQIEGLVCNDPGLLVPILSGLKPIPIFLATWSAIATALEQSKEETAKRASAEKSEQTQKLCAITSKSVPSSATPAQIRQLEKNPSAEQVMIIDDNKTFSNVIERFLAKQGCCTSSFNSAE